ncbi:MAG: UvrD-helicase domain-containing protein [Gemmatimonadota bacterium]
MGVSLLESLNPAQREAVEHVEGPLLVLAGAGSGKTRVLTMRIARLIDDHGVPAHRIFAVTFTNKAATEMKHRIGRLLGRDPSGLWIGTFHSLSARILRREAEALGFTRQFTIYDEDDRLGLIKRLMEQRGHDLKSFTPRAVQSMISNAKNKMQGPDALLREAQYDPFARVAADVFSALGPALRAANAMDFDDLMLHPLTLFREHPERLLYYQQRFQFVLVDEFQDTNVAQYQLIRQIGAHGNIVAVGDDDQAIYSWRGADVRNMLDFQKDFESVGMVRLEDNYRSTQTILDIANGVIAENATRLGKILRTTRGRGDPVTLLTAVDERDEAQWITREFSNLRTRGDWEYRDMAVLYRTNSQSRAFEEAMLSAGVPYRIVGATGFYDRREVKDLIAYLRLIANPADDESFLRAVRVPRRGLGDTSLATLGRFATQWSKPLLETARGADRVPELRPNVREGLRKFAELIDGLSASLSQSPPSEILEGVIRAINFEEVLKAEGAEGEDRIANVRELLTSAAEWSEDVGQEDEERVTPLQQFLARTALLAAPDDVKGGSEGVTLMTLHTAKGLEWPVVALAGMEEGLFPIRRAIDAGDVEEERRLCYVGITRARDKLYVSWARARRWGGKRMDTMQSRFLKALPAQGVREERTSGLFSSGWQGRGSNRYSSGWKSDAGDAWKDDDFSVPKAPAPDEQENQLAPRYVKGERVRHRHFGSGTIQGLLGAGRDLKVQVRFDDEEVGMKQMLVAVAGLERDWESE